MAKEMTVEEAVRVIKESYEFGDKFDEAVAYLKEHDAGNEVLVPFKDEKAQDMIKKARAKAYVEQCLLDGEYDKNFDEAVKILKGDKEVQSKIKDEQEIYDSENHLELEDEDAVLHNTKKISSLADSYIDDKENAEDFNELQNKVEIIDDSGQTISAEDAQKYWNAMLDSAKEQAVMLRAGDKNFFMKKENEKRQTLHRDIKDFLAIGVAAGAAGSAMDEPSDKEVVVGSKDYDKYIKKQADKAEKALDSLFANGQKAKIKTSFFLTHFVDTSKKIASYSHRWLQKGFKKVASIFGKRHEAFDNKMKGLFGKAYTVKQAAVEHVKNNKLRLIADTLATAGVALTAGTGIALPVVAGYALYTAAGSWVWPLVEKKTKAIREAKKSGKDASEWAGFKGLKKAYASVKSDEKEFKKYKNRALTGTAFGIAGAGVVAGMGAASNWAVDKAGYGIAKVTSSVIRSTGSVTSQFLNLRDAKKDFKADPSAENRARLKQAKIGLGLGSVIAFAGNLLAFDNVAKANSAENSGGVINKIKSWFHKDEPAAADSTTVANAPAVENSANGGAANAASAEVEAPIVTAPAAYDASMGISEKHWNEMHQKLTGIYENHSALFGKENVSSGEAWDKMYQNLDNAMKANPEYFGNMTKEQFLYKYMKLIENTERVSNGPSGYLVTKLGKDGLPLYGDKDMTKVMRDMNAMLNCGDKFKVSAAEMNKALDYIDAKTGRYMGPGADAIITNNRYVGGRVECGENYQNAWERAVRKVAAHHKQTVVSQPVIEPEPAPAPAPTPAPAPEPVKTPVAVEEVVTDNAPAPKAPHIEEVVVNNKPAEHKVIINEGATDGNLDVNSGKVSGRSRSFVTDRGGR